MEKLHSLVSKEQERFTTYQTYEELRTHWWQLCREYEEYVRVEHLGRSSDRDKQYPIGRPIEALILSNPEKEHQRPYALLQMEHENELPTTLAIQLIADLVCKHPELLDELEYNLILVNTTHPDGIALQEWVKADEFTPLTYALGFYRSAADEQVAWGYPFRYKKAFKWRVSAENRASMGLIEHYTPNFLHSFHSAAIDDAYLFTNNATDTVLMQKLTKAMQRNKLSLQQGSPEAPFFQPVDNHKGIYSPPNNVALAYDHFYKNGEPSEEFEWPSGTMASDYVVGLEGTAHVLLTEVPYFTANALRSTASSGITAQEAQKIAQYNQETTLRSINTKMTKLDNSRDLRGTPQGDRLSRSLKWYCAFLENETSKPYDQTGGGAEELTASEAFGTIQRDHYYGLLFRGEVHHLALRLGHHAIAADTRSELEAEIGDINSVSPLETLPLPRLVGAQALSSLTALHHIATTRPN